MNKTEMATEKANAVEELGTTISAWSLSSARAASIELFETLYEQGLTRKQDYIIHMEILTFFLVYFQRYALDAGGDRLLEMLNDETTDLAIRLVLAQFPNRDNEVSDEDVKEAINYYNSAAREYDSCPVLVDDMPDYEGKRTVLGKLGFRISELLELPYDQEIIDAVSQITAEALAESNLKDRVEDAAARLV